jgi:3-oxoacyl-(acyl-carrier-protein) synthase
MSKSQIINILGGGWVTAAGFGKLSERQNFKLTEGRPQIPKAKEIFSEPLSRYGRFDHYTKLGCAAIALALKDAAIDEATEKRPIGVIVSTVYECFESDLAFYNTSLEEDGFFSSPNLFSYTLPGIVIGESAIHFKLTGPTFTVGDSLKQKGLNALVTGLDLLNSGACDTVVAGWLDGPNDLLTNFEKEDTQRRGSIFFVLSTLGNKNSYEKIYLDNGRPYFASGLEIKSVLDLIE